MSDSRESQILAAIDMLVTWPGNGRPDELVDPKTVAFAEATGWIKRTDVMGPCKCCGWERPSYSYFLITPAGRAALELHRMHRASRLAIGAIIASDGQERSIFIEDDEP